MELQSAHQSQCELIFGQPIRCGFRLCNCHNRFTIFSHPLRRPFGGNSSASLLPVWFPVSRRQWRLAGPGPVAVLRPRPFSSPTPCRFLSQEPRVSIETLCAGLLYELPRSPGPPRSWLPAVAANTRRQRNATCFAVP